VLKAFLDESGTHAGSLVTAMAGYVISSEALPLLKSEWLALLSQHEMDELHMKEFLSLRMGSIRTGRKRKSDLS
jgi:hypothetical protein